MQILEQTGKQCYPKIIFPINASLFAHLGNIYAEIKFASQEAKMFPKKFRNTFAARQCFLILPTCYRTGYIVSRLDMCRQCFKYYFEIRSS